MDSIKVEPSLEADTNPLVSPDEEKCVYVKEEKCDLPAQICLVKEEVFVSIFSQNKFWGFQCLVEFLYCFVIFFCAWKVHGTHSYWVVWRPIILA